MSFLFLLGGLLSLQAEPTIIVTAAREPVAVEQSIVSATLFDRERLEDLALPAASDVLRLTPGGSLSTSGPRGTQTQLRIRGAEANHSLLYLDGIRLNDPAAGNEARFETLAADPLTRIEVVRGPQSALWGSEAIGGVVAVETADPLRDAGTLALAEVGSDDSSRIFGRHSVTIGPVGMAASLGWHRGEGIDSFGGGTDGASGDLDGFENLSGNIKLVHRTDHLELGLTGLWIEGRSEYDGIDPITFRRADTEDVTRNRIGAIRAWGAFQLAGWSARAEAAYLDSANRNFLGRQPLNSSFGNRLTLGGQLARQVGRHRLILAVERQEEAFEARDTIFLGGTNQKRSRSLTALAGEWQANWNESITTDVAIRHDRFSAFADATTIRGGIRVQLTTSLSLNAAYGEGIAQPSFYDLYGFFPGSFLGNPDLRAERSRGGEIGLSWRKGRWSAGLTAFSNRLSDEIIDVFDPSSFRSSTANGVGRSRRRGLEWQVAFHHSDALDLAFHYGWLDAREPVAQGGLLAREVRRPRHSGALVGHGRLSGFRWGAGLAYVGARRDVDFDEIPARPVRLGDYWLASLSIARTILRNAELFARIENAGDARYQDVVGYNSPGRSAHAGIRVALGD